MLPDWDFNGDDAKRRAFISWVNAELDRMAGLVTARFLPSGPLPVDWLEIARASPATRRRGAPTKPDPIRAADGMDAALWDYIVLKHVLGLYWPGQSRPITDPAHPARIVARRNWRELRSVLDYSDWGEEADELAKAEALRATWKKWKDQPGKRLGDDDVAFLEALPKKIFRHEF
jgi:hypothetical protein